jgi:hypothetical protein
MFVQERKLALAKIFVWLRSVISEAIRDRITTAGNSYPIRERPAPGRELGDTGHGRKKIAIPHGAIDSEDINGPIFCYDHGALDVFQEKDEAEAYFEPWIIEEGLEFYDKNGNRLIAEPNNEEYRINLKKSASFNKNGQDRLRAILIEASALWETKPENCERLNLAELVNWCLKNNKLF